MTIRSSSTGHPDGGALENRHDQVGWFNYLFDTDRWDWSDEVYRLHGYIPGQLPPDPTFGRQLSTEWVVAHCHPDDRERVLAKVVNSQNDPGPVSSRHRIIDANDNVRDAILVALSLRDDSGTKVGIHGFYIDDATPEALVQQRITSEVEKIARSRETIDQAKGMLMAIYGIDGEAAFRVLRGWSQTSNTKLHTIAEQLIIDFTALGTGKELPSRGVYQNAITTIRDRCGQPKLTS